MSEKTRECLGCGEQTTGSVGISGMRWSMLCQRCKDEADKAAHDSAVQTATVVDQMYKLMGLK